MILNFYKFSYVIQPVKAGQTPSRPVLSLVYAESLQVARQKIDSALEEDYGPGRCTIVEHLTQECGNDPRAVDLSMPPGLSLFSCLSQADLQAFLRDKQTDDLAKPMPPKIHRRSNFDETCDARAHHMGERLPMDQDKHSRTSQAGIRH